MAMPAKGDSSVYQARSLMRRVLTVLKMRGSSHDHRLREFTIDTAGMHIREPLHGVSGVLSGRAVQRES